MKTNKVTIELSIEQEVSLMDKFGRGCSRETLIHRALDEVAPVEKKTRKKKVAPAAPLLTGSLLEGGEA